MKPILVVFTGGTIGSVAAKGEIKPNNQQNYQLITQFHQADTSPFIHFDCVAPLELLSENIHPVAWEMLIKAIEVENLSTYAGVIVTHGTDTLAFTAAALSLYFNHLKIPLLLVSSNHPLEHPQANGLCHFMTAVQFIQHYQHAGVFVPYQNPQSNKVLIHAGSRLASCLPLSSDFMSVQSKAYLQYQHGVFTEINPLVIETQTVALKPHFSTRILLIKPYPAIDYSYFSLDNVDVVLHDLYHSGTACTSLQWGENHSLVSLIKRCQQRNIPFFMTPVIKEADIYQSLAILIEQGVCILWNMSLEVAYAKLLLAYGNYQTERQIQAFLTTNIAGEIINNSC